MLSMSLGSCIGPIALEDGGGPFEHPLAAFRLQPDKVRDRLHREKAPASPSASKLAGADQFRDAPGNH